jgi:16S rRNA (guanine1207-N2)-methyltransferase
VEIPPCAQQVSPLVPGAADLAQAPPNSLKAAVIHAPPGGLERRAVLALALRALKPGARLIALAAKDKGGARIGGELSAFGCAVEETAKRHHRICRVNVQEGLIGLDAAIKAGAPRRLTALNVISQPGLFSWDRLDDGAALLLDRLPALKGAGADLGCGAGLIARAVLRSAGVTALHLIDIDRRAIFASQANIIDKRALFHWCDLQVGPQLQDLDFVVTNPPFHIAGEETRALGRTFIRRARDMLRPGGVLWLVANRHLPYEASLAGAFAQVERVCEQGGYKVYEARA